MAYAIVRTDLLSGTKQPTDMMSFKYQASNIDAPIENGNVVLMTNTLIEDSRDTYIATDPKANSPLDKVALVATPEVMYDGRMRNLNQFRNEAGELARGYALKGTFSVTKEALDGKATPVVGDIIELKAGTKLNVAATLTSGSTKVGEIVDIENEYFVIKIG